MKHFLVVFDRDRGEVVHFAEYDDAARARRERQYWDRTLRDNLSMEVVVLAASSENAVRRTHARYFTRFPDLVKSGGPMLTAQAETLAFG